ncbi:BrnA antitoxin family protein [Dyella sp.]|uniref:BrnA antitoxin family protein n=1 Tax=Dyella sp. TaxID=1869338 RepID=UPI00283E3BDE|nr:BrnA antitoxin family protein [Dyella sp.]MDR3443760.1 BrnA antitoxin family protein [Dyella sp.]
MTTSTPTPSARTPSPKQKVTLRLDRDVVAFFKQGGKGFQTRINQVLRAYIEAQQHR